MKPDNNDVKGAKQYFDRIPKQWDAFYSHESWLTYLVNKLLRKGLYRRYQLAFQHIGDLTGATVLDIGCGTGRYSIECAKRGAKRVVGIDFALHMIEFSNNIAAQMGVSDTCEFICGDFLTHTFNESFDVVLALGFFDYIKAAGPVLKKIAHLTPCKFAASFPKFTPVWGFQRTIRYNWIKKCPIYNYTQKQLAHLFSEAPFEEFIVIPCGKGFFTAAGRGQ
jgi:2-polyprenyl-3-methyl-5-hydroxy-6-metoxy-1,4-benzoquinol methylase